MSEKKSSKWILGGVLAFMVILAAEVFPIIKPGFSGHVAFAGESGNSAKLIPVKAWARTYPSNVHSLQTSLAVLPNGDAVLGGAEHHPGTKGAYGWLIGVNNKGNKVWKRNFGPRISEICEVKSLENGNLVVLGSKANTFVSDCQPAKDNGGWWLAEMTPDGKIKWEASQRQQKYCTAFSLATLADSYIIAGTITTSNCAQKAYIARLDAKGSVLWEKQIHKKGQLNLFHSVSALGDGVILATGNSYKPDLEAINESQDWLVAFDTNGKLVWESRLPPPRSVAFNGVAPLSGGGFVLAGNQEAPEDSTHRIGWVGQYTPKGEVIWLTEIPRNNSRFGAIKALTILPNGLILVTGFDTSSIRPKSTAWLALFDSHGKQLLKKPEITKYLVWLSNMSFVPPNDLIISGDYSENRFGPISPLLIRISIPFPSTKE